MLVTLNEVLRDARKNHYAVGLFNTCNLEMACGVIAAAEELGAPVIVGTAEVLLPFGTLDEVASIVLPKAKAARVPVVLHFDHGYSVNLIRHAMDIGFTSVMYDCSTMAYEDNAHAVAALTLEAHARGVSVEAELGHVGSNEGSAETSDAPEDSLTSLYTNPFQALDFVTRTGVDALAVAIGSAHGAYRKKPKLDFARLKEIASLTEAPLVLHGGSGLTDEDFQQAIQDGIAKVNIFTDINAAGAKAAYDLYKPGMGLTDLTGAMRQAIMEATMAKMRLFGCEGRA